jgi:multidrug efflux system outer membrane protein
LKYQVILLLAAMTIGCQRKPIEIRHQPELEVSDHWSSVEIDDGEILSQWWETFRDPILDQLLKKGLENNHDLHAAAARLEAASAQARIAGAPMLPSVSAGWSAMGQRQNFIGFPIPGAEGKVLSRTFKSSGVSLDASWEPDVWGRVAAGKAAAIADLGATQADLRAAKLSLAAQISKAWFAILEGWEQVQLASDTVKSYRKTSQQVRSRYTKGLQSSLDLRLARSNLSSAEALLMQRKQQLDSGIRQLEILLGDYPSAQLQTEQQLPKVPPPPPTGIPSDLVSRRPDLVAAERRMWAAGARWTQARKALYPSFSLTGRMGTSTSDFLQVFNGNFFTWSLSGSVLQPLFQGGRLRAQVLLEDARAKEAAAQWAGSVLRAFSEVESALAAEKLLEEQEKHIRDASQQAAASRQLAEDRYGSGLESIITVLEAQRRSLDAESQRLNIHRQRLDTRVELHLALGGGFEIEKNETDLQNQR